MVLSICSSKINQISKIAPFYFIIINNYSSAAEARRKQLMARGLPKKKPIEGVKNIVLVSSGKGGVGKSTIAVNLAVALKLLQPKKSVGLLDADIFGPTIPLLMNLHDTPLLTDQNQMEPLINYGIKCMSFGFLIDESAPVIWRGLMVMQALEKLMRQVHWSDIDCLIVDTPPGTGDTHLSLVQNLPINGVVLVTTPQAASIEVTKRGAIMYKTLDIPFIGLVENMSSVKCDNCSKDILLFDNGAEKLANFLDIEILQKLPLNPNTGNGSDKGIPAVLNESSPESVLYKNLADRVIKFLTNNNEINNSLK